MKHEPCIGAKEGPPQISRDDDNTTKFAGSSLLEEEIEMPASAKVSMAGSRSRISIKQKRATVTMAAKESRSQGKTLTELLGVIIEQLKQQEERMAEQRQEFQKTQERMERQHEEL